MGKQVYISADDSESDGDKESFDLIVIQFNWERRDCNINPQGYEIQAFTKGVPD